jgi:hypothetical protein
VVLAKIQSLTLMQHKEILDLRTVKTSNFGDVEE